MPGEPTAPAASPRPAPGPLALALILVAVVAAGTWLYWPSLGAGLHMDDYLHLAEMQEQDVLPPVGPLSLFTFAEGRLDRMGPVQGDLLPWWTSGHLVVDFFRPLACATYQVDHALSGDDPRAFHRTNLILWGALVAAVVLLFAALARDPARGPARAPWSGALAILLAGLVFAVDRAHEGNVAWIAGRYGLVSVLFCALTLLSYHAWRRRGGAGGLARTLALLALALLGAENAVGLAGWFLAWELCLGTGPPRARLRALAAPLGLVALYLVLYALAGRGVSESSWYVDPLHDPGRFALALATRLPEMLRDALGSDVFRFRFEGLVWWVPAAILALLLPHLRRDPVSRFALLGALLSALPMAAGPPQPRSMLLPSIGFAWVLGCFLATSVTDLASLPEADTRRRTGLLVRAAAAAGIAWLHLYADPSFARAFQAVRANAAARNLRWTNEAELPTGAEADDARVLLLTSPDGSMSCYLPIFRLEQGHGWPGAIWAVSVAPGPHTLRRTGARSFRLETSAPGGFLAGNWARLFRSDVRVEAGQAFHLGALEVTVAEAGADGAARALDVAIDRDLDAPGVWLLAWNGERWARVAAPEIGGSLEL